VPEKKMSETNTMARYRALDFGITRAVLREGKTGTQ